MPLAVQKLEVLGSSSGGGGEEAIGALQKTIAELEEKINAEERQIEETKAKVSHIILGPSDITRTFELRPFSRPKLVAGLHFPRIVSRIVVVLEI